MGKETKIGLAVIFILLIVFGVVLYNRLNPSTENPSAAGANPKNEGNAAGAEPGENGSTSEPGEGSTAGPSLGSPGATADLDQWSVVASDDGTNRNANQAGTASSPPSFMPKPQAAASDRYGGYGSAPTNSGVTGPWQSRPGDTAGSAAAQQPYDPFQRQTAQTGTGAPNNQFNPVRQGPDLYDSATQQNPLRAQDGNPGSTGNTTLGPPHSNGSNYGYPPSDPSPARTYEQPKTPAYSASPHSTYRTAPELPKLTGQYDSGRSPPEDGTYVVQPNDNYWVISQKLYGTGAYFRALAEHNRNEVPDQDRMEVGGKILAPDVAQLQKDYPGLCPKPSHREAAKHRTSAVSMRSPIGGGQVYVVQQGDTLFDIAHFELGKASRWAEIGDLNKDLLGPELEHLNYLTPGMKLVLPGDESADTLTRQPGAMYQR